MFAINYKYFPKIGSAGPAGPRGRIFFQRLDSWWFEVQTAMSWFDFLYRMCCCGMCCDQRLTNDCNSVTCKWCRKIQGLLGIGCFCPILMICWTGSAVLTTDFVIIARVFSNWHRRIPCSWNHRSVRTTVRSMQDIASMFQSHNSYHDSCCYFPSKKIPFVLLLLLPSFARTAQVQVAAQFFKLVPDVLTCCQRILNLAPSEGNNGEECGATLKTIVAQHFKLLTGLRHSCDFKFLSSGQHTYRNQY